MLLIESLIDIEKDKIDNSAYNLAQRLTKEKTKNCVAELPGSNVLSLKKLLEGNSEA